MGRRDRSSLRSDSGYGDDLPEPAPRCPTDHPLTLKGYEIGPASKLHIGDVFEFLWADAGEFQWEWKCLGYTRFVVLRHTEGFPNHCVCIPISTGGPSKHQFAKPGVDSFQQGYIFPNGEPNPGYEQPRGGPKLQYSPIGVELRPGRIRMKEDSRVNYADIIQVNHDAQVLVVGDVVKYFDRVRRNVNKACMRQILRTALEKYQAEKDESNNRPPSIMESVDGDYGGGASCRDLAPDHDRMDTYTLDEAPNEDESDGHSMQREYQQPLVEAEYYSSEPLVVTKPIPPEIPEKPENIRSSSAEKSPMFPSGSRSGSSDQLAEQRRSKSARREHRQQGEFDFRSMHTVTMSGSKS
ncbi:hypothetical protein F4808DRAFT_2554 [Astrocystis sublimbata]|nr:hypothetical protein F4808DRAFT_2554 [Astrocystis sublimbata]